jgi:hypothetical protein
MSKTDELRRQREAQYAKQQRQSPAPRAEASTKPAAVAAPAAPVSTGSRPKAKSEDDEGKCSVCGKVKALANGLVANHQKGFGKMCPGSRKEPA